MVAPSSELPACGRLIVTTVTGPRRSTSTDMGNSFAGRRVPVGPRGGIAVGRHGAAHG